MNLVRALIVGVAALLLGGGYVASQLAFLSGATKQHADSVSSPEIRALALLLFVACVVLASLKQEEPK